MQKKSHNRVAFHTAFASLLLLAIAGCTTSNAPTGSDLLTADGKPRITEAELRAYCPSVVLREGTAYFSQYEKAADKDPNRLIYQATITDTTRACQYGEGTISIDVAAAGRVVPGPKLKSSAYTMPIRVAILQGDTVIYSKLYKQAVSLNDASAAAQFVFNDKAITIPTPSSQNIQIFVGFDEGPYNTK